MSTECDWIHTDTRCVCTIAAALAAAAGAVVVVVAKSSYRCHFLGARLNDVIDFVGKGGKAQQQSFLFNSGSLSFRIVSCMRLCMIVYAYVSDCVYWCECITLRVYASSYHSLASDRSFVRLIHPSFFLWYWT